MTPISLSRAAYWAGPRAGGQGRRSGCKDRLRRRRQGIRRPITACWRRNVWAWRWIRRCCPTRRPGDWRGAAFARSSVLEAAILLVQAPGIGRWPSGSSCIWPKGLDAAELDQLADLALTLDEPHIAVLIAKQAAERGVILPRAYFPVTDLVPDGLAVSRALALSIARRESEFDPAARSARPARAG